MGDRSNEAFGTPCGLVGRGCRRDPPPGEAGVWRDDRSSRKGGLYIYPVYVGICIRYVYIVNIHTYMHLYRILTHILIYIRYIHRRYIHTCIYKSYIYDVLYWHTPMYRTSISQQVMCRRERWGGLGAPPAGGPLGRRVGPRTQGPTTPGGHRKLKEHYELR